MTVDGQTVCSAGGSGSGTGDTGSGSGSGSDGSSFGGSCAGFTCTGDAIQCAMAKEQHVRNCKIFDDTDNPLAVLYREQSGKEGSQTGDLPGNRSVNIGPGNFDTSDALGGGTAGLHDVVVTVWNKPVTLPFSKVNPFLEYLGLLNVALSFLLAGRIVSRG